MKAFHSLSLIGLLAVSAMVLAQVTTSTSQSTSQQSGGRASSSASGSASAGGRASQGGFAQGSQNSAMIDLQGKKVFAVIMRPGEKWAKDKPLMEQGLDDHIEFLGHLKDRNILVMAGPFTDNSGGEYVIVAKDMETAKVIVANDPATVRGVLRPEVHEWYLAITNPPLMAAVSHPAGAAQSSGR